jgi:hypothetical protein
MPSLEPESKSDDVGIVSKYVNTKFGRTGQDVYNVLTMALTKKGSKQMYDSRLLSKDIRNEIDIKYTTAGLPEIETSRTNKYLARLENLTEHYAATGEGFNKRGRVDNKMRRNVPFGKYVIDEKKLDKNVLSFAYKTNNHPVNNLPATKISNDLRSVILQQLSGNTVSLDSLSQNDKQYLDYIVQKTSAVVKIKPVNSSNQLLNRLKILTGELSNGNDSKLIKNELSQLLNTLVRNNVISAQQAKAATIKYILNRKNI